MAQDAQPIDDATLRLIVGPRRTEKLVDRLKLIQGTGQVIGWNWAALVFGGYWLTWRRAYGEGWFLFALSLGVTYMNGPLGTLAWLMIHVGAALFGDYLYFLDVRGRVREATILAADPADRDRRLAAQSGSGWSGHLVLMLLLVPINAMIRFFFFDGFDGLDYDWWLVRHV
jgi:hypothetical protein